MNWYCEKCKKIHVEDELCPNIKYQLSQHPEWLKQAVEFTTVAGEEALITTQALDGVAQQINKVVGTKLSYEGTKQYARDIQVFKRLSEERFKRSGAFATPDLAKSYYENVQKIANDIPRAATYFDSQLTGYSQEADWLLQQQGKLSSLFTKSNLEGGNAAGIDGVTTFRFGSNHVISRTTVKATTVDMKQNIEKVKEAIAKGNATADDIIFGPKGTKIAARKQGLTNPVEEFNSIDKIKASNERLKDKILAGQANTAPTLQQVGQKVSQGTVVAAVIAVTISSITNYARYKNGEITREEAFAEISEDTIKGTIIGGAMGAITIFLPCGALGHLSGMAIGVYLNATCTNVLDEIYGKGAYGAILNASGYVYGMTYNLESYYKKIKENEQQVQQSIVSATEDSKNTKLNFALFEQMKEE